MKNLLILFMFSIGVAGCSAPDNEVEETMPQKVAEAYGIDQFDQVTSIAYTWNVQVDSAQIVSRDWVWDIKSQQVRYKDMDTTLNYSLDTVSNELKDIDHRFTNDKYWLLFPFQLAWDKGYSYEVEKEYNAPISGKRCTKLTIVYNDSDGYTPGDAYDLFIDDNHMILEWIFRKGNQDKGRPMTWEGNQEFDGIKISTEHKNEAGERKIWFTNIQVN